MPISQWICYGLILHILVIYGSGLAFSKDSSTTKLRILSESLRDADIIEIRDLIKNGADVNVKNKYGLTPLYMAAQNGHAKIVIALLEAGADVDAASRYDGTPLYMAAQNGYTKIVIALLEAGADVNPVNKSGATPLFKSAELGYDEIVTALLKAGAEVNSKVRVNGGNYTALDIAEKKGHIVIMKLLKGGN